ncbi:MAG: hypothetical protein V1847_01225 [Candidatus Diapherotrites archaeon]
MSEGTCSGKGGPCYSGVGAACTACRPDSGTYNYGVGYPAIVQFFTYFSPDDSFSFNDPADYNACTSQFVHDFPWFMRLSYPDYQDRCSFKGSDAPNPNHLYYLGRNDLMPTMIIYSPGDWAYSGSVSFLVDCTDNTIEFRHMHGSGGTQTNNKISDYKNPDTLNFIGKFTYVPNEVSSNSLTLSRQYQLPYSTGGTTYYATSSKVEAKYRVKVDENYNASSDENFVGIWLLLEDGQTFTGRYGNQITFDGTDTDEDGIINYQFYVPDISAFSKYFDQYYSKGRAKPINKDSNAFDSDYFISHFAVKTANNCKPIKMFIRNSKPYISGSEVPRWSESGPYTEEQHSLWRNCDGIPIPDWTACHLYLPDLSLGTTQTTEPFLKDASGNRIIASAGFYDNKNSLYYDDTKSYSRGYYEDYGKKDDCGAEINIGLYSPYAQGYFHYDWAYWFNFELKTYQPSCSMSVTPSVINTGNGVRVAASYRGFKPEKFDMNCGPTNPQFKQDTAGNWNCTGGDCNFWQCDKDVYSQNVLNIIYPLYFKPDLNLYYTNPQDNTLKQVVCGKSDLEVDASGADVGVTMDVPPTGIDEGTAQQIDAHVNWSGNWSPEIKYNLYIEIYKDGDTSTVLDSCAYIDEEIRGAGDGGSDPNTKNYTCPISAYSPAVLAGNYDVVAELRNIRGQNTNTTNDSDLKEYTVNGGTIPPETQPGDVFIVESVKLFYQNDAGEWVESDQIPKDKASNLKMEIEVKNVLSTSTRDAILEKLQVRDAVTNEVLFDFPSSGLVTPVLAGSTGTIETSGLDFSSLEGKNYTLYAKVNTSTLENGSGETYVWNNELAKVFGTGKAKEVPVPDLPPVFAVFVLLIMLGFAFWNGRKKE